MKTLPHLMRGQEVLVGGQWYPVSGYSLSVSKHGTTGSVFTTKAYGRFEPQLGYRLNYKDIEDVREEQAA